jgi:hypothetical protein
MVQSAKHLNLSQEFPGTLLVIPLKNLDSNPFSILKNTFIDTPKTTLTNNSGLIKYLCSSLHLNQAKGFG